MIELVVKTNLSLVVISISNGVLSFDISESDGNFYWSARDLIPGCPQPFLSNSLSLASILLVINVGPDSDRTARKVKSQLSRNICSGVIRWLGEMWNQVSGQWGLHTPVTVTGSPMTTSITRGVDLFSAV